MLIIFTVAEKDEQIRALIETEPLTFHHIEKLQPHSNVSIIPYNQEKSKRYGMILYNTSNRPGAIEEADNLYRALAAAGTQTSNYEFSGSTELRKTIKTALQVIISDCSLLVVCVMSHGGRGSISGDRGEEIPIKTILQQLVHHLPKFIPLVSYPSYNSYTFN